MLWMAALWLAFAPRTGAVPCEAPARRALDFWIGEWTVVDRQGRPGGSSRIEATAGGCAILERFDGSPGGLIGSGLHTLDSAGAWVQYWVDNRGVSLVMQGTLRDGAVTYQWIGGPPGSSAPQRYSLSRGPDDTVVQTGYATTDGGATWRETWSLTYRRKAR